MSLDGKQYIETDDDHIAGAGAVGVWTKADSVTLFDDFNTGRIRRRTNAGRHENHAIQWHPHPKMSDHPWEMPLKGG